MRFRNYVRKRTIWLEWQKILFPDKKELIYSEIQLKRITAGRIKKDSETIDDCNLIFRHTIDPKIFFKYLKLYFDCKNELIALDPYIDIVDVKYPEALYYYIGKQQLISQFLHRYGEIFYEKADGLENHAGHEELWKEFYNSLKDFDCEMDLDNIHYYMNLYTVNAVKYKEYNSVKNLNSFSYANFWK